MADHRIMQELPSLEVSEQEIREHLKRNSTREESKKASFEIDYFENPLNKQYLLAMVESLSPQLIASTIGMWMEVCNFDAEVINSEIEAAVDALKKKEESSHSALFKRLEEQQTEFQQMLRNKLKTQDDSSESSEDECMGETAENRAIDMGKQIINMMLRSKVFELTKFHFWVQIGQFSQ